MAHCFIPTDLIIIFAISDLRICRSLLPPSSSSSSFPPTFKVHSVFNQPTTFSNWHEFLFLNSADSSISNLTGFELSPSPSPVSGVNQGWPAVDLSPSFPTIAGSPAPAESSWRQNGDPAPSVSEEKDEDENEDVRSGEIPADPPVPEETTVRWCAVTREEFLNCQIFVSRLNQLEGYTWRW